MFTCQFCFEEKKNKRSLIQHEVRCLKNSERINMDYCRSVEKTKKLKESKTKDSVKKWIEKRQEKRFWKLIQKEKKCKKCWLLRIYNEREKIDNEKNYCSRACANSRNHTEDTKKKTSETLKSKYLTGEIIPHRLGKGQKHTLDEKRKIWDSHKKRYLENPQLREEQSLRMKEIAKTRIITTEMRKKYSDNAKKKEFWWHTSKKSIYYPHKSWISVYLQSSYEVKVARSLDENNIDWIRPKFLLWKDEKWLEHRYYPDFFLPKYNIYLDPKNDYLIEIDKEKIEYVKKQNNVIILILGTKELSWEEIEKK